MVEFGELDPETGTYRHIRTMDQMSMRACPHFLMTPEHFRADGTCRCDDWNHKEMEQWGYEWDSNVERWV
jgi:hypothetical protein